MTKQVRIKRATKDKDNPYKSLRRATFDGSGLSFEARGVLAYVLMKPDDWELNITDLMREGGIGRDKAYRILDELIEAGYAARVGGREKSGKFGSTDIEIYEAPHTEKPYPVEPYPEEPYPENTEHTNKGINTNKGLELKKEGEKSPAPADYGRAYPARRQAKQFVDSIAKQRDALDLTAAQFTAITEVVLERMNATAIANLDTDMGADELKQAQQATLALASLGHKTVDAIGIVFDTWDTHDWRGVKGESPTYKTIVDHAKDMDKKVAGRKAAQPKLSEVERTKILTRANNARSLLRTAEQFGGRIDPTWQRDIEAAKGYGLI